MKCWHRIEAKYALENLIYITMSHIGAMSGIDEVGIPFPRPS